MTQIYQIPRHDRDPHPLAHAEDVLVTANSVVPTEVDLEDEANV